MKRRRYHCNCKALEPMERRPPPSYTFASLFGDGGGAGTPSPFSSSTTRNADDTFASRFGGAGTPPSSSPFNFNHKDADLAFKKCPGFGRPDPDAGAPKSKSKGGSSNPAVETLLPCSLEDLYKGAKKKMTISRKVADSSGKLQTIKETLDIEIRPGWKKGTKILFSGKGNQEPGFIAADLIYVIDEKPHEVFTRDGNDLIINRKIPLLEALTGKTIEITTLDGRNLVIPVTEIIKPGYEVIFPNEGTPISKEPTKKGNLVIKFDVEFPTRLTSEQKYHLEKALAGSG